jgi:hypothetical protein
MSGRPPFPLGHTRRDCAVTPSSTTAAPQALLVSDRRPENAHALWAAILCPGCARLFTPARPNQRHCTASCRAQASRTAETVRRWQVLERLDPGDPGRAE